jgi:diguanylate cyclase (GGDEF)-like protein
LRNFQIAEVAGKVKLKRKSKVEDKDEDKSEKREKKARKKPKKERAKKREKKSEINSEVTDDAHLAAAEPHLVTARPTRMFSSRLSWRIAISVFIITMLVQFGLVFLVKRDYESARIYDMAEIGRSAIAPLIDPRAVEDPSIPPVTDEEVYRLISTTKIKGVALYSAEGVLINSYGEQLRIGPGRAGSKSSWISPDGATYEVTFSPNYIGQPFIVVISLDLGEINRQVQNYVKQSSVMAVLVSIGISTIIMMLLGRWLLEPILFLRSSLLSASNNPENPGIMESPYKSSDEMGSAIEVALNLIKQNSVNMKGLKSTAKSQIHKLAYYDTLTGLPNRTLFIQSLNEHAKAMVTEDASKRFAIVVADIDHFKDINDNMGYNIGDAILRSLGRRLRSALPDLAIVARSGEDEFAVTMEITDQTGDAYEIARNVAKIIKDEPFKVFSESFQIRASIGMAIYPDDGVDPDQVLKNADIALNRAKEDGRDTIKVYSEDFNRAVQKRFQVLRELRDAMEQNQLLLYFQPQLDLRTGEIIGAEALIRWWRPDSNMPEGGRWVSPSDFIPVAEQSGLIVPIGEWVMETACNAAVDWQNQGHDLRVAINVSGVQFYQSDIVSFVDNLLKKTSLPPERLELEITESVFMKDINQTVETLHKLHNLGIDLAIDDFGTGYSSLSYLRMFPIDRLKIDQSFIRNSLSSPDDAAITRTIIRLGHSLNLSVIAEGVETEEHEAFLISEDCDEVQGFRYSRAVSMEGFIDFIKDYEVEIAGA